MDIFWPVIILVVVLAIALAVQYAIIRAAVLSALREHTLSSTTAVSVVSAVPLSTTTDTA